MKAMRISTNPTRISPPDVQPGGSSPWRPSSFCLSPDSIPLFAAIRCHAPCLTGFWQGRQSPQAKPDTTALTRSARMLRSRICFACSARLAPCPVKSRQDAMDAASQAKGETIMTNLPVKIFVLTESLFPLEAVVSTPGAIAALEEAKQLMPFGCTLYCWAALYASIPAKATAVH
jgi:hypothetical protein